MERWLRFAVSGILFLDVLIPSVQATHNRAGEITYVQISQYTFEFTITTFTYSLSAADRDSLGVTWGDNTTSVAPRIEKVPLPNFYNRNKYVIIHSFPGPGVYEVVVEDPNRNFGVLNIPNSVNVIFSVKTTLIVNSQIGSNSTPLLLNPPIDKAALNYRFVHNPAAFDPDGDSLSYKLTICTTEGGKPIQNYTFPEASDTLYVDPVTGDLVWDAPVRAGIYNIAINIEEWRKGVKIGNILRDMQVDVFKTANNPPVNPPLQDLCVIAGDTVSFEVTSIDPNKDLVTHWDTGGVYLVTEGKPRLIPLASDSGYVTSRFVWYTLCSHVRNTPYNWILKAEDNNKEVSLVDIDNMHIRVIAPPPENLNTTPTANTVILNWTACECQNITGYHVFRRAGPTGYLPDSCEFGIPPDSDYVKIGQTSGWGSTVFVDDNGGQGLLQGTEYCYLVVAAFADGTYSIASNEACAVLVQGTPVITNVSITDTDPVNGIIDIAWLKPRDLDTIPAPGPYEYIIYRSPGLWGSGFQPVHTFTPATLDDTTYTDTGRNTLTSAYSYKVELYNNEPGNRFLIGNPGVASSIFLSFVPGDNRLRLRFNKNVPWINKEYVIYRQNHATLNFDSIAITTDSVYVDTGLVNGKTYCYFVKGLGTYSKPGFPEPLINFSQENCGIPVDLEPPCPPLPDVSSFCDSFFNRITWKLPSGNCGEDVTRYNLYYTNRYNSPFALLATVDDVNITSYDHYPAESLAGCYVISAVDSFDNESRFSTRICIDECSYFELPNVFTPNGDGVNDYFKPRAYRFVKSIGIEIYNRYGELVFKDSFDQPEDFSWDGKIKGTNKIVSPGVYYYLCDVWEERLTGIELRNISGFIHVYTEKDPKISDEKSP